MCVCVAHFRASLSSYIAIECCYKLFTVLCFWYVRTENLRTCVSEFLPTFVCRPTCNNNSPFTDFHNILYWEFLHQLLFVISNSGWLRGNNVETAFSFVPNVGRGVAKPDRTFLCPVPWELYSFQDNETKKWVNAPEMWRCVYVCWHFI